MLDHITLRVHDISASKLFYRAALAPLGYELKMDYGEMVGFGVGPVLDFWLRVDPEAKMQHVAFHATDRAAVDAFHRAATAAGGRDNGAPGLRTDYHPNYYAGYVFDPTGHNIEAVCHAAPGAARPRPARTTAKKVSRRAPSKKKATAKPARRASGKKARRR